MLKRILFLVSLLFCFGNVISQTTFYTYQNGDWNNPTTWTLDPSGTICTNPNNEFPNGGDEAIILNGVTITVNINDLETGGTAPSLDVLEVQAGAVLDFQGTINHDIDIIRGEGTIRFSGNGGILNYPTFADPDEFNENDGDVELYGSNAIIIDDSYTVPNLVINMDTGIDVFLQIPTTTTLQINKDLRVRSGDLLFANTADFSVEIFENVRVETSGTINIQSGADVRHQFNLHGDFLNLGTVQFSDRITQTIGSESTDVKVDFNLVNVSANQTVICNGLSYFYRIEVAKQNRVYIADFTTSISTNFVLTGPAFTPYDSQDGTLNNPNALAVVSGTCKITAGINIGLLNNTGIYSIPENARLWVAGGTVAHSGESTVPYGTLEVSGGSFTENGTEGIILRGSGLIQVDGGAVTSSNIRTSFTGAGSGQATGYLQSGGTTTLTGGTFDNRYSVFSLPYPSNVFQMTGGVLSVRGAQDLNPGADATNGAGGLIYINTDAGNVNVTGGTVIVTSSNTNTGNLITSRAPFYNLIINNTINSTDINARVRVTGGSNGDGALGGTTTLTPQDLVVLNDLTIQSGTLRTADVDEDGIIGGTTNPISNTWGSYLDLCPDSDGDTFSDDCVNLEVGRNLTIQDNAVLDVWAWDGTNNSNSATVTFNRTSNGVLYIGDITNYTNSLVQFSNPISGGVASFNGQKESMMYWEFPFYNLVIDKLNATLSLSSKLPGKGETPDITDQTIYKNTTNGGKNVSQSASNLIAVIGQLSILRGTLRQIDPYNTVTIVEDDGTTYGNAGEVVAYSLRIDGNQVVNEGNLFIYTDASTTPKEGIITFRDGVGNITLNTTTGATFGNLRLSSNPNIITITSDAAIGRLEYVHGILDIDRYNLKIDVFEFRTDDGVLTTLTSGQPIFDANNYIRTTGNASDGGLSIKVPRSTSSIPNITEFENLETVNLQEDNQEYNLFNILWFPIGTNASGSDKYTPALCYVTGGTYTNDEYITIRPADRILGTSNQEVTGTNNDAILSYYWRVSHEGFATGEEPNVAWLFQYDDADVDVNLNGNGSTEADLVPGKVLDGGTYSRFYEGNNTSVKDGGDIGNEGDILGTDPRNIIIFNGVNAGNTVDASGIINPALIAADITIDNIETATLALYDNTTLTVNADWSNTWQASTFTLENANYTAGVPERFIGAPRIYYSTTVNDGNNTEFDLSDRWNETNLWSTVGHYSNVNTGTFPQNGDIAILGFGLDNANDILDNSQRSHWFFINTDVELAELIFAREQINANGDIVQRRTALGGSFSPQLIIDANPALNIDLGIVSGQGTINTHVRCAPCNADPNLSTASIANLRGDFGDFVVDILPSSNIQSRFDFDLLYNNGNAVYVPSTFPTEYPELHIKGQSGTGRTLIFQEDITVNSNLRLRESATLRLNEGTNGDIHVKGDTDFIVNTLNEILEFSSSGTSRTFRVDGDIVMAQGGDLIRVLDNNNPTDVVIHTLQVGGNITQVLGQIDLYNGTGANHDHAILELIGTTSASYTQTSQQMDLYKLVVNKGTNNTATFTFENDFRLPLPSDIGIQPLEIVNGTLILDDPGIDIQLTDATTGSFYLPNTLTNAEASSGSGSLEVRQGEVFLVGDMTTSIGLYLDGTLTVSGGRVNIGEDYPALTTPILTDVTRTDNRNNFLEYSSSGNARIVVSAGELNVGGQIRRSPFATSGILKYTQTGGTVRVGIENDPSNWVGVRGVFEVTNNGSWFRHTGGVLEAISGRNPLIVPDILIDAQIANTTGGTILTSGLSDMSISATNPLGNVEVASNGIASDGIGDNKLQMNITNINIDGSLNIGTGATFDSQSLDIFIGGDFNNFGTYNPDADDKNTTTFDGVTQAFDGTGGTTNLWNMTVNSSNSLTIDNSLDVKNLLRFGDAGIVDIPLAATELRVEGNIINNGEQTGLGRIVLTEGNNQTITSDNITTGLTGIFNNLEIRKIQGRVNQTDFKSNPSTVRISNNLYLNLGASTEVPPTAVYNLGDNLMVLGPSATVTTSAANFSANNMIKINGVESSFGLRKEFNSALTNFVFPIGTRSVNSSSGNDKYTPITISLNAPSDNRRITVRPIDDLYPSNKCGGVTTNILEHYWAISTNGGTDPVTGVTFTSGVADLNPSSLIFGYFDDNGGGTETDVTGIETGYANARLRPGETAWDEAPFATSGINVTANTAEWDNARLITYGGTDEIAGEYTLGAPASILNLEFFRTVGSGDWSSAPTTIWEAAVDETFSSTTPNAIPCSGAIAFIQEGHTVSMVADGIDLGHAIIEGTLDLQGTVKHAFTQIEGNGRIIARNPGGVIPGGETGLPSKWGASISVSSPAASVGVTSPAPFTGTNGRGTIEFSSPNGGTTPLDYSFPADKRLSNIYGLEFSGTGSRGFGLQIITINGDLTIGKVTADDAGPLTVNQNKTTILLKGDLTKYQNDDILTVTPSPFNLATDSESDRESFIVFNGNLAQSLEGEFLNSKGGNFYNFELDNSAGITINNGNKGIVDIGSDGLLLMKNGFINVSNHELNADKTINSIEDLPEADRTLLRISSLVELSAGSAGTASVTDFNNSKLIDGPFCRELNAGIGEYVMPLGDNSTNSPRTYGPLAIVNPSGGTRYWCAQYFREEPINWFAFCPTSQAAGLLKTSTIEHWWLEDSPTGGTTRMKLYWGPHSNVKSQTPNLRIVRYEDPSIATPPANDLWCDIGITEGPIGNATGVGFAVSGDEGFSDHYVTLATIDFINTPLPVELISFNGIRNNNFIELTWLTASEINNSHFEIEKSKDGLSFNPIARVEAVGKNINSSSYQTIDKNPIIGINYYRLKQVDLDGTATYSEVIAIKFELNNLQLNHNRGIILFPNPLDNSFLNIRFEGFQDESQLDLILYDLSGRKVLTKKFNPQNSLFFNKSINIPSTLSKGMYILNVSTSKDIITKKLMLR